MIPFAIGLAALALAGPVQGQPPALSPSAQQAVQLRRAHAFLNRCNGEPWLAAVFNAEFARTLAQLAIQEPSAVPSTNVAATQAEASDGATPCDSAAGRQFRQQVAEAADTVAASWVLRMGAMLRFSEGNPWAAEITTLAPYKARITALNTQMSGLNPAAYSQMAAVVDTEARIALRLICPDRRALGSTAPRACPDIPAEDRSSAPIATALVVGAERIAPLLPAPSATASGTPAAPAAPASNAREYYVWRAASARAAWDGKCNARDLVIKPNPDRPEGFTSLLRYGGDIARYGEIYVVRDGSGAKYAVFEADPDAARLGIDKAGSFQQCRS